MVLKSILVVSSLLFVDMPVGAYLETTIPPSQEWIDADGSCLEDAKYPELSAILHSGVEWPFGRCDQTHFKLPKFECSRDGVCRYKIRVK